MTTLKMLEPGAGDTYWLLGTLTTVKADAADTDGRLTVVEFEIPSGWSVPPHRHREEDELFYVLDGEVTFWCDGGEATFTRGGMAWLPRMKPHTFTVTGSTPARLFNFHTGPLFGQLLNEIGQPAAELRLPDAPSEEPDPQAIARVFDRAGIDLVDTASL